MIPDQAELNLPHISPLSTAERFSDDEMAIIMEGFSRRFRSVFEGENQSSIARTLKTTHATVEPYLKARRLPIAEMLIWISRKTGINIHWLLTGEGARRVPADTSLFTNEQESEINRLAKASGRTFDEQVAVLASAALEFRNRV